MLEADSALFRLDTFRGCKRYHVDNLPFRTVVTYYGLGTEYLTEGGANWDAYECGAPNEEIVKDLSAIHTIAPWDVAVFRGGSNGLLHKTPAGAMKTPSMFMRVDPTPNPLE